MEQVIEMAKPTTIICRKCGMPLVKGTKVCSYCHRNTGYIFNRAPKKKAAAGLRIGGWKPRLPWVSFILILLNAATGLYKLAGGEYNILYHYGMMQGALQRGEYLRFILNSFLHSGWTHFISNMYALLIYGFIFENRIGRWKYLLIYLASIFGSSLLINFIGGSGIHIGATGAIWGLMAANLVYSLYTGKIIYLLYAIPSVAGNLLYTFRNGVSWQGHIGGAIAGILLSLILFKKERDAGNA